jgi:hypothetical protein
LNKLVTQEDFSEASQEFIRGKYFVSTEYEPKDEDTQITIDCILKELGIFRAKDSDLQKYRYCLSDFFKVADLYRDRLICWQGSSHAYDRGSAYSASIAKEVRVGLIRLGYLEPVGRFSVKDGLAQPYRVIGSEIPYDLRFKCHGIGPKVIVRNEKEKCYWKPDKKGTALGRGTIIQLFGLPLLAQYEADVERLNKLNLQYPLEMPDGQEFATHKRIFVDGRLDVGGRHYGGWQNSPEALRLQATIGGEPVVEIDLKAAHPNILNAHVGNGESLGVDPYANIAFVKEAQYDGDRKRLRDAAKMLISAYLCKDGPMSRFPKGGDKESDPTTNKLKTVSFKEKYQLDHSVNYYMAQIFEQLPFLQNKDRMPTDLTFIESEIMRFAVNNLIDDGSPCYLVHDCLLVRESDKDAAIAYLQESLFKSLGHVFDMDVTRYGHEPYLAKIPSHYPTQPTIIAKRSKPDMIHEFDDFDSVLDDGDEF